jgi:hypothetical protein
LQFKEFSDIVKIMKSKFLIIVISLLALCLKAQVLTVTNGQSVLTISNNAVVSTAPLAVVAPLVNTNGQVIPAALAADVATSLGIPAFIVNLVPLKLLLWIGALIWFLPYAGRAWHSYQADGGAKGIFNAVVFGTNVPVAMKLESTGQPVVPQSQPPIIPQPPKP